jgi:hypothetical protein
MVWMTVRCRSTILSRGTATSGWRSSTRAESVAQSRPKQQLKLIGLPSRFSDFRDRGPQPRPVNHPDFLRDSLPV